MVSEVSRIISFNIYIYIYNNVQFYQEVYYILIYCDIVRSLVVETKENLLNNI